MHTLSSDGIYSGNELIEMIKKYAGKKIIAITDHDSVDEYFKINYDLLKDSNIILIPGIEFSFSYKGVSKDILAYGVDLVKTKAHLDSRYTREFKIQKQRNILIKFKKLAKEHNVIFDETMDVINGNKSEAYGLMLKSIRSNPINLERFPMFEKGFYRTNFSNPNSEWFIDETEGLPTLDEVIKLIHDFGGKAFLAHPYDYKADRDVLNEMIKDAIKAGVDGIEVDHSSNKDDNRESLQKFVNEYSLLQSGGSDFHGETVKKGIKLFIGMNSMRVYYDCISPWINTVKDITKGITKK